MSKLFDQLKDAARSREEKSPGLLADALRRQQEAAASAPDPVATPGPLVAPVPVVTPAGIKPGAGSQLPTCLSQFSGIGLALLIFLVAVLAWRSSPFTPPRKLKIDPSELRLDRTLDLQRLSPKGTSPPGRPS